MPYAANQQWPPQAELRGERTGGKGGQLLPLVGPTFLYFSSCGLSLTFSQMRRKKDTESCIWGSFLCFSSMMDQLATCKRLFLAAPTLNFSSADPPGLPGCIGAFHTN